MSRPRPPVVRPALLAALALVALAACRSDEGAPGADSVLSRDLTLAAAVTPRPALADTLTLADTAVTAPVPSPEPVRAPRRERQTSPAPASAPRRSAPAERPAAAPTTAAATPAPAPESPGPAATATPAPSEAPGAGHGRAVGAGTQLALSTTTRICNETMRPGDRLVAALTEPVAGPDGAILLPTGTQVVLELTALGGSNPPGGARLEFLARGVSLGDSFVPLVADVPPVEAPAEKQAIAKADGADRGKVIKGAIAGAILGRVLGGGAKGTVIGAATGAAAGAATAAASTKYQLCVAPHVPVRVRLVQPLALP